VSLVADDEIPLGRGLELLARVLVARDPVEARDEEILLLERVARARGFDLVARQDVEVQVEPLGQFVLPLLDEVAGRNDQAAFEVARTISSLMNSPAMIVLPAPASSASRKRIGCRGSLRSAGNLCEDHASCPRIPLLRAFRSPPGTPALPSIRADGSPGVTLVRTVLRLGRF